MHAYIHTYIQHTYIPTVLPSRSFTTSFVFPSFSDPATTFETHYWKKLTCGVIRSFNFYIVPFFAPEMGHLWDCWILMEGFQSASPSGRIHSHITWRIIPLSNYLILMIIVYTMVITKYYYYILKYFNDNSLYN